MSFIGQDWRSPGDKWIRTEFGWKRLADIRYELNVHQVVSQRGRTSTGLRLPRSEPKPPSALNVNGHSDTNGVQNWSEASAPQVSSATAAIDNHTKQLMFLLSQRCVSARKTSLESNHYSTISDAINKMNFIQALGDENCFQFICKVITLLYEQHYHLLSGTMQTTLLRITDAAKEIAIETKKHTGLVMRVIEAAVSALGQRQQLPGLGNCSTDAKIKSLMKMKRQLVDVLHRAPFRNQEDLTLSDLPQDCLRHIVSFLLHPRDVLHFGQTNHNLYLLTEEDWIWRSLAKLHYDKGELELGVECMDSEAKDLTWRTLFEEEYRRSKGSLREEVPDSVYLCSHCKFVFWKSYGHPCCASKDLENNGKDQLSSKRLTAEEFLQLFCY